PAQIPGPTGRCGRIRRPYTPAEVARVRGSVPVEHSLARRGANRLWELLHREDYVQALGAVTGNQAMQMVRAGLKAIYLSGWQVAADANTAGAMYPDQSLYPANAGPELCRRINRTLQRADQIEHLEGGAKRDWFAPILADAEAGVGGVPTILVARTDAESARLITSDIDENDREFLTGERTAEGFFRLKEGTGLAHCIKRGLAFAPHADLLWWETSQPNLADARI